jgi:serine protease Do
MVQPIDDTIAKAIGLNDGAIGAMVATVVQDSPAYKAGIKIGDVILRFNGQSIDGTNKLPRIVGDTPVNTPVDVEIFRNGKVQKIKVIVTKPERNNPFTSHPSQFESTADSNIKSVLGVSVANLNNDSRKAYGIDSAMQGVVVTDIDKGSILAFTGVRPGDVIVTVNHQQINNVDDFENFLNDIKKTGKGSAALLVSRKGMNQFIGIEVK